jgi:hypothetical protein
VQSNRGRDQFTSVVRGVDIMKNVLRDVVHGNSVLPEYNMLVQYVLNCSFIYACKKSTMFHKSIFVNLASARQHYVQMSYNEFRPHRTINATEADGNYLRCHVNCGLHCTDFRETRHTSTFNGHLKYRTFRRVLANLESRAEFYLHQEVRCGFSPYGFLRNSQLLNGVTWRSPLPHFTQIC